MKKHFHIHIKAHAGLLARAGKDPYADWLIILILSTVATIVLVYFSITLFLYINDPSAHLSSEADSTSVGGTLDRPDLVKLIADFQDKKSRISQFQNGYQGASDPSGTATSTFSR